MPSTLDEVLSAALQLPAGERLQVARQLMQTLPDDQEWPDDDAMFWQELERRSGDWDGSVSWEQLREELSRQ